MRRILAGAMALCLGCAHGAVRVEAAPALAEAPLRCVAVAPFVRVGGLPEGGRSSAELAASLLERGGRVHVLEPAAWPWALEKLGSEFRPADARDLQRFGERLGADAVLFGEVGSWGYSDDPQVYRDKQPHVALTLQLVRTADAAVLAKAEVSRRPSRQRGHIALLGQVGNDALAEALATMTGSLPAAGDEACLFERLPRMAGAAARSAAPAGPAAGVREGGARPTNLSEAAVVVAERLQRGAAVPLRAVSFEYRTLNLQPGADEELDTVAELLRGYADLGIAVVVHTDNVGEPSDLRAFTLRQAEIVREALLERGAQVWQVAVEGLGGDEPILPNINRRNRQVNRRVELRLVVPPSGGW